jgi:hypothetical protein
MAATRISAKPAAPGGAAVAPRLGLGKNTGKQLKPCALTSTAFKTAFDHRRSALSLGGCAKPRRWRLTRHLDANAVHESSNGATYFSNSTGPSRRPLERKLHFPYRFSRALAERWACAVKHETVPARYPLMAFASSLISNLLTLFRPDKFPVRTLATIR